jgi:hypothetical protein
MFVGEILGNKPTVLNLAPSANFHKPTPHNSPRIYFLEVFKAYYINTYIFAILFIYSMEINIQSYTEYMRPEAEK